MALPSPESDITLIVAWSELAMVNQAYCSLLMPRTRRKPLKAFTSSTMPCAPL